MLKTDHDNTSKQGDNGIGAAWSAPKLRRIAAADTEGKFMNTAEDVPEPGFGPS